MNPWLSSTRDSRLGALDAGWTAEEALAIALHAALASDPFENGLRFAVTHSGDSDSIGAIAGNLLGLIYPEGKIAHLWRRAVECADIIDRLARDLDAVSGSGFDADHMAAFYPGWWVVIFRTPLVELFPGNRHEIILT
ncbi:ADP-ribosylglycohydrolase family protein [Roseovarius spongiae]|uniref:ADP-ribosylglycohydrolase family protein n=1 Tax=Roseovarius spongiae TaxID=2320272 RepID=A0A3A8ASH7_9RHOB|nr:ADP-ribosylglycohydrolase family protein [Roseovarius spongiae]RKF13081.1 ADP-ribosylglycohydrolase family protein [Roseovarius spongiae]